VYAVTLKNSPYVHVVFFIIIMIIIKNSTLAVALNYTLDLIGNYKLAGCFIFGVG